MSAVFRLGTSDGEVGGRRAGGVSHRVLYTTKKIVLFRDRGIKGRASFNAAMSLGVEPDPSLPRVF